MAMAQENLLFLWNSEIGSFAHKIMQKKTGKILSFNLNIFFQKYFLSFLSNWVE